MYVYMNTYWSRTQVVLFSDNYYIPSRMGFSLGQAIAFTFHGMYCLGKDTRYTSALWTCSTADLEVVDPRGMCVT